MATTGEHYDGHLGPIYSWMAGPFERAVAAARADIPAALLTRGVGRHAMDLGAGTGAHAFVLEEAGYAVTAVDSCAALLDELRSHCGKHVRCVAGDLINLRQHCERRLDVVLCMGDTLTHLPSPQSVEQLIADVVSVLSPGGTF